jgi:hypothetical protein
MADPYEIPPDNPAFVVRPEPIQREQRLSSHYQNFILKNPSTRQQRKKNQEYAQLAIKDIISQADSSKGKQHQRFTTTRMIQDNQHTFRYIHNSMNDKYTESMVIRRLQTIEGNNDKGTQRFKDLKARLKVLTPLMKKLNYDPLRIINHQIKNNLL